MLTHLVGDRSSSERTEHNMLAKLRQRVLQPHYKVAVKLKHMRKALRPRGLQAALDANNALGSDIVCHINLAPFSAVVSEMDTARYDAACALVDTALAECSAEARLALQTSAAACVSASALERRLIGLLPALLRTAGFSEWLAQSATQGEAIAASQAFSRDVGLVKRFFSGDSRRITAWFGQFDMKGITHFRLGSKALADYSLAHREHVWYASNQQPRRRRK